jgi:hypothetical protein
LKRLFLALFCLCCAVISAQAQDFSKKQRAEIRRFASNNSLFVLYHEIGHLLFHQLELPVLGREEDAADNMATWTLLNKGTKEANRALADAAQGWILSGIAYDSGGDESDYAAGHTLDKQRAYQIVCLMVGMDEKSFEPIANEYRMANDRQDSCHWDYDTVNRSLKRLLGEDGSKDAQGTDVTVVYHDAGSGLEAAADAFKSSGVFDQVADELRHNYSVIQPVAFNAKRCGEANAFYNPETVEVIFCYELMQDYMDLYSKNIEPEISTGPSSGKNKAKPSPGKD